MAQLASEPSIIDLGVLGGSDPVRVGRRSPPRPRRPLVAAVLAVVCLLGLAGSARGRPGLGEPLWTGAVSLNGFTLGPGTIFLADPDGTTVRALDLLTGQPRWSLDIIGLPDSTNDVGNGVAAVTTRPLSEPSLAWPTYTITLVRLATGETITQTTGFYYLPSVGSQPLLVFNQRRSVDDGCDHLYNACLDVAGWDVTTGTRAWQLSLPPGHGAIPSIVDDRVDGLVEVDGDGTVRRRDLATGAVIGSTSPHELPPSAQVASVRDVFLTAVRGPTGIALTAYRQPSFARLWSVTIPDLTTIGAEGRGGLVLSGCGSDACLVLSGVNARVIDLATGSATPAIGVELVTRLGDGVFLATALAGSSIFVGPQQFVGPAQPPTGLVLDRSGRTIARLAVNSLVDWNGSGNRALLIQSGPARTGFVVIDERGDHRSIGSVPGTNLNCRARADIMACADPVGTLRVWRLPV